MGGLIDSYLRAVATWGLAPLLENFFKKAKGWKPSNLSTSYSISLHSLRTKGTPTCSWLLPSGNTSPTSQLLPRQAPHNTLAIPLLGAHSEYLCHLAQEQPCTHLLTETVRVPWARASLALLAIKTTFFFRTNSQQTFLGLTVAAGQPEHFLDLKDELKVVKERWRTKNCAWCVMPSRAITEGSQAPNATDWLV